MKFLLTLFLSLSLILLNKADDQENGLQFVFERIETFNDTGILKYDYKIVKQEGSDSVRIDANLEWTEDLDNNWKSNMVLYKKNDKDEYIVFISLPEYGVCEFMEEIYHNYLEEELVKYSNLPKYDECPVLKRKCTIKDYPMEANKFQKYFVRGEYRLNACLKRDNIAVTCVLLYGSITDKK